LGRSAPLALQQAPGRLIASQVLNPLQKDRQALYHFDSCHLSNSTSLSFFSIGIAIRHASAAFRSMLASDRRFAPSARCRFHPHSMLRASNPEIFEQSSQVRAVLDEAHFAQSDVVSVVEFGGTNVP